MSTNYERTAIYDLHRNIAEQVHDILGITESGNTNMATYLHMATYNALTAFHDILCAAVCAQAGVYSDVQSAENEHMLEVAGVNSHIEHAEHELNTVITLLKSAKAQLAAELGQKK